MIALSENYSNKQDHPDVIILMLGTLLKIIQTSF